jgi:IS5 family transposase
MPLMKQSSLGLGNSTKRTRKREFLAEMERVVPWASLVEVVAPLAPEGRRGRPPFSVETMLRIHFMQQWFTLSDPAMEEALHDMPLFREFAGLGGWSDRLPDETTILRFRHLLEKHKLTQQILQTVNELLRSKGLMLRAGTVVDATLIAAPSSTKNQSGERDPEMHQSKKGNQWYFGMKAHIGVDAESNRAWCTPCAAPRATSMMWSRPMRCCTVTRPRRSPMPATRARISATMPSPACAGTSRCARAHAPRWTRRRWSGN